MFLILATVMIGENLLETPKENEIENTQLKFRGLEKKKIWSMLQVGIFLNNLEKFSAMMLVKNCLSYGCNLFLIVKYNI